MVFFGYNVESIVSQLPILFEQLTIVKYSKSFKNKPTLSPLVLPAIEEINNRGLWIS
jgi:hypothetical protein